MKIQERETGQQETKQQPLKLERRVQASAAEVFRAFTNAPTLQGWLCDAAEVEPRQGGRIYLWWNNGYYTGGTFTELTKDGDFSFTWRGPNDPTQTEVRVALKEQDGATTVTLTHSGDGTASTQQQRRIWEDGLENLQSLVEEGIDLRLARRPMFGLSGGDELNPQQAAKLGVPVKEGIWLAGLVDGMGAQSAGLQKDDVLVSLSGKDIVTWPSLGAALQEHRAGDQVPVVFYRGPEKHTVTVTLSSRPKPDVPTTAAGLAEVARGTYTRLDAEIEGLFAGVSEKQAEYAPNAEEWNAKEVLAHLIAVERDSHSWITSIVEDTELETTFNNNARIRMKATVEAYPTVPGLLEELKRSEHITLSMVAAMPEAAVSRKYPFYQLGFWLTTFETHTREHIDSIRELLQASK